MDNFNIQKFFKDQYLTEDYTSEYDEETAKRNMFAAKYNTPEDTKRFRNYMEFLSKLRTSGKTNMFGAAPYLQAEFNLDKKEAKDLLAYWMGSYRNPDLDESLNENFEMGDKVKLTPDYEETPGEVFTITQTSGNRYFIADEDGRGWYTYADQLVRADDEYVNEAMVDYDFSNEELIRVIKQLKRGASTEIGMIKAFEKALGRELTDDEIRGFKLDEDRKAKEYIKSIEDEDEREEERKRMFDNDELDEVELTQDFGELDEDHTKRENDQLKKIEKELKGSSKMHKKQAAIIKRIVKEAAQMKISEPRYIKDKNNPNFLKVFIDYPTPEGAVMALGKETMSGQIRRLGAAAAMQKMNKIAKDLTSKYNIEDIEVTDMENGKIQLFAVSDDFEGEEFKYLDENINDPVLMRARAARDKQPEPSRGGLDFEDIMYLRDDKKDLEDRIARLYREMEQEAEPEGGPIADQYADELHKLENELLMVKKQINQYDMNESLNEALNPEVSRKVNSFIRAMAERYDYSEQDAIFAIMAALKQRMMDDMNEGSCGYTPDGKPRSTPAGPDLMGLKEKIFNSLKK